MSTGSGTARKRLSSLAVGIVEIASECIQYMACSTSSRTRMTSSSSIAAPILREDPDGFDRQRVRVVVQRRDARALGERERLVPRDRGGDLEVVVAGERVDGLELALGADLVGDQR